MSEADALVKIVGGVISWRQIESQTAYCLAEFARMPGVELAFHAGDALVERARSTMATQFLESDRDVLLTIDSDIVFRPADAYRLALQAAETRGIVAAVYPTRSMAHTAPASLLGDDPVEFGTDSTPLPVKWAASGFMAIHRSVFERLAARPDMELCHVRAGKNFTFRPFYHTCFGQDPEGNHILLSEDFAFCQYAAEEGIPTYINPSIRLGHLGSHMFTLEDLFYETPQPMPMVLSRQGLAIKAQGAPQSIPTSPVAVPRAERRRQARVARKQPVAA